MEDKSAHNSVFTGALGLYCDLMEACVVARDGIEPPTPAFSGPRSTTELSGHGVEPVGCAAMRRLHRNVTRGLGWPQRPQRTQKYSRD